MNQYIITIDVTSKTTRAVLWDNEGQIKATTEVLAGLNDTVNDGNNQKLKKAVSDCIKRVMEMENIIYDQISKVVTSGMMTSGIGLYEIPHVCAPAGLEGLAKMSQNVMMEDVCPIPITFIPGVKNPVAEVTIDNFEEMDIMRGEEIDCIAVLSKYPKGTPYLIVLSEYYHTKFISVDEESRMTGCLTTITGDLLSCITHHTDIGGSVGEDFVCADDYDKEMMLKGYEAAKKVGLGRIAFSTKILNIFVEKDKTKLANFLLGAALAEDLQCIKNSKALSVDSKMSVIISAKKPLSDALADVFVNEQDFGVVEVYDADKNIPLPALGMYQIAKMI